MELVEGRVRLTFDLGSGALILTSSKKYNTGVWFKITLQRNKRKGSTTTVLLLQTAITVFGSSDKTVGVFRLPVHHGC